MDDDEAHGIAIGLLVVMSNVVQTLRSQSAQSAREFDLMAQTLRRDPSLIPWANVLNPRQIAIATDVASLLLRGTNSPGPERGPRLVHSRPKKQ